MVASVWNSVVIEFIKALIKNMLGRVTFYWEIRIERWRLLRLAKSKKLWNVTVVFDLKVIGPGYGDFLYPLHTAFVLQKRFNVKIVFVDRGLRPDWRVMNLEKQKIQKAQYLRMAHHVLKNPTENLKLVNSLDECKVEARDSHIVFKSRVLKKRGIWHRCNTLTSAIFDKLGCGDDQLFGPNQFGPLRIIPNKKFVVWHVRRGNLLPGIVEPDTDFIEQYHAIRKILGPEVEIILLSSPSGLKELMLLSSKMGFQLSSSREYSDDFVGDLNLVHSSELYIQLGNGGMFASAVASKTSYFLTRNSFTSSNRKGLRLKNSPTPSVRSKAFGVNIAKGKVNSFQTEFQVLQKQNLKEYPKVVVNWAELAALVVKLNIDQDH